MSSSNNKKQSSNGMQKLVEDARQKLENASGKVRKKDNTLNPVQIANLNDSPQLNNFPNMCEVLKQDLNISFQADFIFCSPRSKNLDKPRTRVAKNGQQVLVVSVGSYITHEDGKTTIESRTPTVISSLIYFTIVQMWYEQGSRKDGYVTFSGRDLFGILDLKAGKTSYKILQRELAILKSSILHWQYKTPSHDGGITTSTEEINLLSYNSRIKKEDLFGGDKFTERYIVQIDERIIKSTLSGYTKIFQQKEYVRIARKSYDAAILYHKLNTYLTTNSSNKPWRIGYKKLLKELGNDGKRYELQSKRKEKIRELKKILEGAKLSVGILTFSNKKEHEDKELLYPKRINSQGTKTKNIYQKLGLEGKEFIIEEIIKHSGLSNRKNPKYGMSIVEYYATTYPENVILDAISRFKSDAKYDPTVKSRKAVFTIYLHREVHRNNLHWGKECKGKDCQYRKDLFT